MGRKKMTMEHTPLHLLDRQWSDENFEPIGAAMDRLFDLLGWRVK